MPSDRDIVRVRRLIAMTIWLGREWHTRSEIAERFGVSERRVTDDLAVLEAAGVTIERKYGRGYRTHIDAGKFEVRLTP